VIKKSKKSKKYKK